MPPSASGPQVSRNDPCPCGSGKKYKKCCMVAAGGGPAAAPAGAAGGAGAGGQAEVEALFRQAASELRARRAEPALRLYRRVLRIDPRNADAFFYLGRLTGDMGQLDRGIRLIRQAISIDGTRADYHVALAQSLLDDGRPDDAMASAVRAVRVDGASADGHGMQAECHDRGHRTGAAIAAARAALAIDPAHPHATIILGRSLRRSGERAEARQRLEGLLGRDAVSPYFLHQCRYELGAVLDDLGEHDEAYAAFDRAGREQASLAAARGIDRTVVIRRIDRYRASLTRPLLERWSRADFDDGHPAPSFLVGFPRSGTTLTEQVIAAHPAIVTADEKAMIGRVKREMARALDADDPEDVPSMLGAVDRELILSLRAGYWSEVAETVGSGTAGRIFVDKLPLNIVHAGLINVVFPEARLIVALRDPRDVCMSCFKQWFGLNSSMIHLVSLEGAVALYVKVMDLWLYVRDILTVPFVEVRYEDTVRDLETQARRLLEILGAGWDDDVLRFHEHAKKRFISTPSYAAVARPVHTKAIGGWQNYRTYLEPVLPQLERFVEAFGYGRS